MKNIEGQRGSSLPLRAARRVGRLLWMAAELMLIGLAFLPRVALRRSASTAAARVAWFHWGCRRALRAFGVSVAVRGSVPSRGLLVSNHLGYLDVLVLGALAPAVFVAKSEVRHWPIFGWFARRAGTLFINRARRADVVRLGRELEATLAAGLLVVLFAEGTSTDGRDVLPFKPSLFEPVARSQPAVCAGFLRYALADAGDVGEEVCYWRDMTFVPHLWNLLGKRAIQATVAFAPVPALQRDRKELAAQLRAAVLRLKELTPPPSASAAPAVASDALALSAGDN